MFNLNHFSSYFELNAGVPHADTPPTNALFHYTNAAGMKGIIEKNELWATHSRYLNDESEVTWGINVFLNCLREREDAGDFYLIKNITNKMGEMFARSMNNQSPYIFCLSSESNLLNQWRFYGGDETSYAIGIRTDKILKKINAHNFKIYKIIYNRQKQKDMCLKIIGCIHSYLLENIDTLDTPNEISRYLKYVKYFLDSALFRLKNPAFKDEREWRIVVTRGLDPNFPKPDYRIGKYGLIPYRKIHMPDKIKALPISKIVVGPGRYTQLAVNSLEMFLDQLDRKIPVTGSGIPIR